MCVFATGVRAESGAGSGTVRGARIAALALALALGMAALPAAADTPATATTAGVMFAPWWAGGPVVAPWSVHAGACMAYGICGGGMWDDRRPWRRPVAPDPPSFADQDIWGASGSPWGYVRRLPPPTPESQIQPAYRDASTIRPEFEQR